MISYISGKVLKSNIGKVNFLEVLISNGIGYRVYVTSKFKFQERDSEISLYTSFQVREESQSLYGFNTESERDFFEQLLTISGVGPKVALSILSTYEMERVREIVLDGDSKLLSKVPGLGSKGAQKIILELRGKIDFDKENVQLEGDVKLKELKEALKSLGYTGRSLDESMKKATDILSKKDIDIEELIRKVLEQ
ncbi:MAG: Holliday junction branch migration protein RuvA [Candidatus Dojkabacteria bacterium]|jgi:Holliday junction DNA helicase RuvA|nr:Holliday junction branch migration protein RuvA [Candidatus Dojkabacteria bacterium]